MSKALNQTGRRKRRSLSIFKRGLNLLLVLMLLLSLVPTYVFGVDVNGSSGSIWGSTGSSTGDYAVWSDTNVLGYRFTLAEADGTSVGAAYDVFSETNLSSFLSSHKTMLQTEFKYSKMEYQSIYEYYGTDIDFTTTKTSSKNASDHVGGKNPYSKLDSDLGITLPGTAAEMVDWGVDADNIEAVLKGLWDKPQSDLADKGWTIAIEPIYAYKCFGNYFASTVTEIAIAAFINASLWDGNGPMDGEWDGEVRSANDSGLTWKWIANRTHRDWPNSLYLKTDALGLNIPRSSSLGYRLPSMLALLCPQFWNERLPARQDERMMNTGVWQLRMTALRMWKLSALSKRSTATSECSALLSLWTPTQPNRWKWICAVHC